MKLRYLLAAALVAFIAPAARADQSSTVIPLVGPHSMGDLAQNFLNPAFAAVLSHSSGSSGPTNGPGGVPIRYQYWADTSTTPTSMRIWDGAQWVKFGELDISGHLFNSKSNNASVNHLAIGVDMAVVKGDGSTDNCTALNAALQAGGVTLPSPGGTGYYYSSCTIIVPNGSLLKGEGVTTHWDSGGSYVGGVAVICAASVSPCVQVGGNTVGVDINSRSTEISHIKIGRQGATNTTLTNVGLQLKGGLNTYLTDVHVDNSGICILLRTPPGTGTGISVFMDHMRTERCKDVHLWNDSFPEVRVKGSRFGNDNSVGSNAYIRVSCTQNNCTGAGTPNTMEFTNDQFNSSYLGGADVVNTLWDFKTADTVNGYDAGDYGVFNMSDCHVEVVNHAFQSDSTWPQIKEVLLTNNTIVTLQDFFNLNAATNLWRWNVANNLLVGSGFTLNGTPTRPMFQEFVMTGNAVGGNATFNGTSTGLGTSTAYFSNNDWENNLTLSGGTWGNLTMIGGSVASTYTNSATGNVNVFFDRETKIGGTSGVTCNAGVSATTGRAKNGILTAC